MKATNSQGLLREIPNCFIDVPHYQSITFNNLPDISDSKSAAYNDEAVIGRSTPIKTFSHSENRSISLVIHMFTLTESDISKNIADMRALESCVYPRDGNNSVPFIPPVVCRIVCGELLGDSGVCVVLKSYTVKYPTDLPWDDTLGSYLPSRVDVETTWDVVYHSQRLPGQDQILHFGS